MGWFSDAHPGHEGYLVGVVRRRLESSALWRELGPDDESERVLVERLAVGCDCGWRSPHFHPPFGLVAKWAPFVVSFAAKVDNEAGRGLVWRATESANVVWRAHIESCKRIRVHDACVLLSDLAAGVSSS